MAEEENKNGEKASWNFSADHAKLVFEKLKESQEHKNQLNIGACFESLRELFDLIEYNLNEDDVEKIDKKIIAIAQRKKYWNIYNKKENGGSLQNWTNEDNKRRAEFIYGVRKFQRSLLRLLKKVGYLTNKVDDSKIGL